MSDEDDDFNHEYQRARKEPVRVMPPRQGGGYTRCMECNREGARMRVTPDGRRLVCTGVFEGSPLRQIDCYDRIERAQAVSNGEEYAASRERIRAENADRGAEKGGRLKRGDW